MEKAAYAGNVSRPSAGTALYSAGRRRTGPAEASL